MLITKEDDFVYLIPELWSDCVRLSNKYAKIVMPSARFHFGIMKFW